MALRLDWKQDQVIPINADDPAHREMLWRRFQKMIDRGCTLFYLDSFGADLEHVKLMRFLRERMGRKISDLHRAPVRRHLAVLGRILGNDLHGAARAARNIGSGRAWRTGGSTNGWPRRATRLAAVPGRGPDAQGLRAGGRVLLPPRITPLVPVSDFARLPQLGPIQAKHLAAPAGRGTAPEKGKNGREVRRVPRARRAKAI